MDRVSKTLAEYITSIDYSKVPLETRHEVKRRIIDSVAVAMAAYTAEPVALSRRMAAKFSIREGRG